MIDAATLARREHDKLVAAYRLRMLTTHVDPREIREWNQIDPGGRRHWRTRYNERKDWQ